MFAWKTWVKKFLHFENNVTRKALKYVFAWKTLVKKFILFENNITSKALKSISALDILTG
jgi:hypothetical protein